MTIYNDITENIVKDGYNVKSYVLDINHEANCYIFINNGGNHSIPYLRAVQIMYEIRGIDVVKDDRFNKLPAYIGPDTNNEYHLKDWEEKPDIKHVYTIRYNSNHNTYEFEQVKGVGVVSSNVNDTNELVELIFDNLERIIHAHEIEEKRKDRINKYKNRINSLNENERKRLVSAILDNISKRKED